MAPRLNYKTVWLIVLLAAGVQLLAWLWGFAIVAKERGQRRVDVCAHNMKQIGIALQSYRADFSCYPPLYTTDETGRPMHSWRALLLPYVEAPSQAAGYDLSQPWDSQWNQQFASQIPQVFRCASSSDDAPGYYTYAI